MRNTRLLATLGTVGALLFGAGECLATTQITRDFENDSLAGVNVSGNAPTVQSQVKRGGRYAMRSYLDRYGSPVSFRTEARVIAPDPILNKDYWYGFSIYLPDDFAPDTVARWETVAQWHANPDAGEPDANAPLALSTLNGKWTLNNKWTSDRISKSGSIKSRSFALGSYARGRWTDWVFHIRWSYGSTGILEVWRDGNKVVSAKGPNTYNDARLPFFKMGIYKGWKAGMPVGSVTKRVLYHDDFRMTGPGGSFSTVSPAANATTLKAPSGFTVQ